MFKTTSPLTYIVVGIVVLFCGFLAFGSSPETYSTTTDIPSPTTTSREVSPEYTTPTKSLSDSHPAVSGEKQESKSTSPELTTALNNIATKSRRTPDEVLAGIDDAQKEWEESKVYESTSDIAYHIDESMPQEGVPYQLEQILALYIMLRKKGI